MMNKRRKLGRDNESREVRQPRLHRILTRRRHRLLIVGLSVSMLVLLSATAPRVVLGVVVGVLVTNLAADVTKYSSDL